MPSVRSSESARRRATRYTVAAVRDVTAAALRPNGSLICAASGAFAAGRECLRLLGCLVSYRPLATRSIISKSRSFIRRRSRSASFRCVWLSCHYSQLIRCADSTAKVSLPSQNYKRSDLAVGPCIRTRTSRKRANLRCYGRCSVRYRPRHLSKNTSSETQKHCRCVETPRDRGPARQPPDALRPTTEAEKHRPAALAQRHAAATA